MSQEDQGKVVTRVERKAALKTPPMYRVLLHNDDFTPREFVVLILQHVFHLSEARSTELMLYVHNNGVGVIGIYPFSVAETKVAEVAAASEKANFPLLVTLEPDSDPSDAGEGGDGDFDGPGSTP
ncbi:MAG: ATP-dependent Clp protease adaptor ClpS [Acidobacteria bacterium]|nr:MAG: ATP-dependent Clp protease adaptor ClpS [Acidobacteriota bacterium]REJ99655.1 MAG: ATP-dependent Clp protease adaptor ClpS [Acidobacteriota bacterium]